MFSVSTAYTFNNKEEKAYTFHAKHTFALVNPDLSLSKLTATATPHTAILSTGLSSPPSQNISRHTHFVGCTADQQNIIDEAVVVATDYVANGYQYSLNLPSDATGDRYTTWFGVDVAKRHTYVTSILNRLNNNDFSSFTYNCRSCSYPNTYAYVVPSR